MTICQLMFFLDKIMIAPPPNILDFFIIIVYSIINILCGLLFFFSYGQCGEYTTFWIRMPSLHRNGLIRSRVASNKQRKWDRWPCHFFFFFVLALSSAALSSFLDSRRVYGCWMGGYDYPSISARTPSDESGIGAQQQVACSLQGKQVKKKDF